MASEEILKERSQPQKLSKHALWFELNEHMDIAPSTGLVTDEQAKDAATPHPSAFRLLLIMAL